MLLCCLIVIRVWPIIRFLQSLKTLSLVETILFGLLECAVALLSINEWECLFRDQKYAWTWAHLCCFWRLNSPVDSNQEMWSSCDSDYTHGEFNISKNKCRHTEWLYYCMICKIILKWFIGLLHNWNSMTDKRFLWKIEAMWGKRVRRWWTVALLRKYPSVLLKKRHNNRIYMYSLFFLFCVQAIQLKACSVLVEILYLSNFAIIKLTCIRWIGSWCKWLFKGRWWPLQKEVIKPSWKTQLSSQRCEDQHEQLHITLCRFT